MSKELIVRLRKFIGGELGNGAADALESLEAAYSGAVEAGKALAKQALKAERDRDAFEKAAGEEAKKYLEEREKRIAAEADRDTLAAELKALRVTQQNDADRASAKAYLHDAELWIEARALLIKHQKGEGE